MELRFYGTEGFRNLGQVIKEGFQVWTASGMDLVHCRDAVEWFDDGSTGVVSFV